MMDLTALAAQAVAYDRGDPKRVHHLMKVWAFCRLIAAAEGLDAQTCNTLEAAAILHDIGIHEAERKHGSCVGPLQEQEGPAVAAPLLRQAGTAQDEQARVLWLIAHHHSYNASEDLDFRILLEADFLVNAYEENLSSDACRTAGERLFRTETGRRLLQEIYLAPPYRRGGA